MWNYIRIKFKYVMIKKLEYNLASLNDIEEYYDEVFQLYLYKFEPDLPKSNSENLIEEEVKTPSCTIE
jgi:hypothetical protein